MTELEKMILESTPTVTPYKALPLTVQQALTYVDAYCEVGCGLRNEMAIDYKTAPERDKDEWGNDVITVHITHAFEDARISNTFTLWRLENNDIYGEW